MDRHYIDFFLNIMDSAVHMSKTKLSEEEKKRAVHYIITSTVNLRYVQDNTAFDHIEDIHVREALKEMSAFCRTMSPSGVTPEQKKRFIEIGKRVYEARKARLYPGDSPIDDLFRGLSLCH